MKNSFATAVLLAMALCAAPLSAQMSDDDFVDIGGNSIRGELLFGFQWKFANVENSGFESGPSIALSFRAFPSSLAYGIDFGFSALVYISFLNEMTWIVPRGVRLQMGENRVYNSGEAVTVKSGDADSLSSVSAIIGPSIRTNVAGGFGFVFDFGLSFSGDSANWRQTWYSLLLVPGNFGFPIKVTSELELTTLNIGLGANAGLQLRMGSSSSPVFFEAGANLSYYFGRHHSYRAELYWGDNVDNNIYKSEESGAFESVKTLVIGAPYIMVGFKF